MNSASVPDPARRLRLWPGVVAAALLLVLRFAVPIASPDVGPFGVIGAMLCAVLIIVWWVFFSRAPRVERWGAGVLMIAALVVTLRAAHVSVATGGMGGLLFIYALPTMALALVVWAVASRGLAAGPRRATMVAAIVLACGVWTLVRTGGITSDVIGSEFHWRWTPTAEERLLADAARLEPASAAALATRPPSAAESMPTAAESVRSSTDVSATDKPSAEKPSTGKVSETPGAATGHATSRAVFRKEWPGFRGAARDSIIRGVRINPDWTTSPPVALWRRAIGPGWSSFAVSGDFLYTQEQRGDDEIVAGYRMSTGEPVWVHRDAVRFWESNGGAGPRATPTLSGGRIYAFGATGVLNALDAGSGALRWSRNVASDTDTEVPMWGFASSPVVVDDVVVVAASGTLAAYEVAAGKRRWIGPRHDGGYSSPQLVTIGGVDQILLLSGSGATSVAPSDGSVLWEHSWSNPGGVIVQPAVTAEGDILINGIAMTGGTGIRRLAVAHDAGQWTATERWTSTGLKPYFNDFVVHRGHAYGFDGSILASIDLADGTRKWKGGRYGNGQIVLLADQDLLLVTSEEGELALVRATPDQFTEIARFPALDGKTWNHPVLVGDVLLVRNGEEMAAFRLSLASR